VARLVGSSTRQGGEETIMTTPLVFTFILLAAAAAAGAADNPAEPPGAKPGAAEQGKVAPAHVTARQIVERIKQNVGCPWAATTVDTVKAGNPDVEVAGVAVTFMASLDVLQQAAAAGRNFVITHEPTFYNHWDKTAGLEGDKVLAEKQAFIEKHGMVVWRFHDHWHARKPDGIIEGVARKLGWEKCLRPGEAAVFDVPETTLQALAGELKTKLHASVVRVVGKPPMKVSKVAMCPGAGGSAGQIKMLQRDDVDVVLAGETPEWETVEYVRDAAAAGKSKALVLLGHANSEEAGMEYCAEWLKGFVTEVPIQFIAAGDPFWSPK
jgi:putative NIF3 family GTP cyclohydrolase 1 type 2